MEQVINHVRCMETLFQLGALRLKEGFLRLRTPKDKGNFHIGMGNFSGIIVAAIISLVINIFSRVGEIESGDPHIGVEMAIVCKK